MYILPLDSPANLCYHVHVGQDGLLGHNNTLWKTIIYHPDPFVNPFFAFFLTKVRIFIYMFVYSNTPTLFFECRGILFQPSIIRKYINGYSSPTYLFCNCFITSSARCSLNSISTESSFFPQRKQIICPRNKSLYKDFSYAEIPTRLCGRYFIPGRQFNNKVLVPFL